MFFGSKKKKTKKEDTAASLSNLDDAIALLNQFSHPQLVEQWASQTGWVRTADHGFRVTFPFAAHSIAEALKDWLSAQSDALANQFELMQRVAPLKTGEKTPVKGVKNLIVVSSAKGGVGKSTTAVNLALALHAEGAAVGIVDADVYGPSLPIMLGAKDSEPQTHDGKLMEPVTRHGIASNSIGYLVPADNATVWRGPMASKAFAQLINETRWPELDYLVVDMPPGTGDIQLSLAQQFPVTGAIVVTTPQDLALADAVKGVAMFEKVHVPVLGVVENMSYHICSQCGHHEAIFGSGGADKMAQEQGTPVLAQVPLHVAIREDIDAGVPSMVARPNSEHAAVYRQMAASVASQLYWQGETRPEQISVQTVSP
ncbi:iron-sulfur cluster carrier protein ApbC [Salinivibrio sp. IB643]|jgi:ATPases involved in chromosome partitioning|uniref:iron-sulfur cluster carrier protein ApbC n=1 Tax=Salinivibrio sp. IB643 TaxID=1909445 RepID=UPI0009899D88|nr:iron-sulfur cluster carrier protein ApbC [Salinivibrio sp. IB643]